MFERERAEIRILSNVADAHGMSNARDLLRKAEAEFKEFSDLREKMFCTTDVGDGSTIYDVRPRA